MSEQKQKKRRVKLFVVISWLWVRLKLTIEMSRLAIFRIMPKAQIQHVSYTSSMPPPTFWSYDSDTEQLTFMNFDREKRKFIIYDLPPLSKS